jgi:hypothetical protein
MTVPFFNAWTSYSHTSMPYSSFIPHYCEAYIAAWTVKLHSWKYKFHFTTLHWTGEEVHFITNILHTPHCQSHPQLFQHTTAKCMAQHTDQSPSLQQYTAFWFAFHLAYTTMLFTLSRQCILIFHFKTPHLSVICWVNAHYTLQYYLHGKEQWHP